MSLLTVTADSLGRLPSGAKALSLELQGTDVGAPQHQYMVNNDGTALALTGGNRCLSIVSQVNSQPCNAAGEVPCDVNGNIYAGFSSSGSNTSYFTLQYNGVQL